MLIANKRQCVCVQTDSNAKCTCFGGNPYVWRVSMWMCLSLCAQNVILTYWSKIIWQMCISKSYANCVWHCIWCVHTVYTVHIPAKRSFIHGAAEIKAPLNGNAFSKHGNRHPTKIAYETDGWIVSVFFTLVVLYRRFAWFWPKSEAKEKWPKIVNNFKMFQVNSRFIVCKWQINCSRMYFWCRCANTDSTTRFTQFQCMFSPCTAN